jgi:hypothetical protein
MPSVGLWRLITRCWLGGVAGAQRAAAGQTEAVELQRTKHATAVEPRRRTVPAGRRGPTSSARSVRHRSGEAPGARTKVAPGAVCRMRRPARGGGGENRGVINTYDLSPPQNCMRGYFCKINRDVKYSLLCVEINVRLGASTQNILA